MSHKTAVRFTIRPPGLFDYYASHTSFKNFFNVNPMKKKQTALLHFSTVWLSEERTLLFILHQIHLFHICLSLFALLWPDLFWSFIISPLLLFHLPHSDFFFPLSACVESLQTDIADNESQFTVKKVCLVYVYLGLCVSVRDSGFLFQSRVIQG